jgi:hypothetical protein
MQRFGIVISVFALSFSVIAADKKTAKADAEATQRAAEAAEEELLNPESALKTPILRGTFALNTDDSAENPKIIGTFTVDKIEYRVELSRDSLRQELEALNGKTVSMSGKIRDNGKTFIVQTIERGGPPPAAFSNPRGL